MRYFTWKLELLSNILWLAAAKVPWSPKSPPLAQVATIPRSIPGTLSHDQKKLSSIKEKSATLSAKTEQLKVGEYLPHL